MWWGLGFVVWFGVWFGVGGVLVAWWRACVLCVCWACESAWWLVCLVVWLVGWGRKVLPEPVACAVIIVRVFFRHDHRVSSERTDEPRVPPCCHCQARTSHRRPLIVSSVPLLSSFFSIRAIPGAICPAREPHVRLGVCSLHPSAIATPLSDAGKSARRRRRAARRKRAQARPARADPPYT